jgi:hypothetical protein
MNVIKDGFTWMYVVKHFFEVQYLIFQPNYSTVNSVCNPWISYPLMTYCEFFFLRNVLQLDRQSEFGWEIIRRRTSDGCSVFLRHLLFLFSKGLFHEIEIGSSWFEWIGYNYEMNLWQLLKV